MKVLGLDVRELADIAVRTSIALVLFALAAVALSTQIEILKLFVAPWPLAVFALAFLFRREVAQALAAVTELEIFGNRLKLERPQPAIASTPPGPMKAMADDTTPDSPLGKLADKVADDWFFHYLPYFWFLERS